MLRSRADTGRSSQFLLLGYVKMNAAFLVTLALVFLEYYIYLRICIITAQNINVWREGSVNECTVQHWFQKSQIKRLIPRR